MYNATYDGEKCTSRQLEKGIVCLSMSIRSRVTTKNVKKNKKPKICDFVKKTLQIEVVNFYSFFTAFEV